MFKRAKKIATGAKEFVNAARTFQSDTEKYSKHARVWDSLADDLKTPTQWLGSQTAGCFATHNVYEACDFSCTACYLTKDANQTPPLPFEEVKAQLDHIREHAGPGANLQITAGEVTLLPVDDLLRIVKYSRETLALSPMVMTHGQTFMKDPSYLHRLMREGGLEKVSIHMDTTQRGRIGQTKDWTETDVNQVRNAFADLIRNARKETGRLLYAATTYTVTENNIDDIPMVMNWMLNNADAFRMISFQPTADVGRTRDSEQVQQQDLIWGLIAKGIGQEDVNPNTFYMGHPKCNQTALMFAVKYGDKVRAVEVTRPNEKIDKRFFEELMDGSFRGFSTDGTTDAELAGRYLAMFLKTPKYFYQWPLYILYRVFSEYAWLPEMLASIAKGEPYSIKPLVVVAHNFMSSHELDTAEGKERLDACVFKLPVDGEMVSMCEMNGTDLRGRKNRELQELHGIRKKSDKKKKQQTQAA